MWSSLKKLELRCSGLEGNNPTGQHCVGSRTLGRDCLPPLSDAEHIMAMPAQRAPDRRWTEEEFYVAREAAPPGERWELVDGQVLVTPSPHWVHQRLIG